MRGTKYIALVMGNFGWLIVVLFFCASNRRRKLEQTGAVAAQRIPLLSALREERQSVLAL